MGAQVTSPPILVDPTNFSRQFGLQINPMGIFQVGSSLYLVLTPNNGAFLFGVYKGNSTGSSWAEQDAAHHLPVAANTSALSCCFDPATGNIHILVITISGGNNVYEVVTFSTTTNLYTVTSGFSGTVVSANVAAIYCRSNGTRVIVGRQGNSPAALSYLTLTSGGTWNGPNALGSVVNAPVVYQVTVDASDNGHLVYRDGATSSLTYVLISTTYTLSSSTVLELSPPWDQGDVDMRIFGTNIAITWTDTTSLKVAIGTPLSAPVFTTYTLGSVASSGTLAYPTLAVGQNGNLVDFAAWVDVSGSPAIDQLLMWTFNGSTMWGVSVLFYDEVANPPANSLPQVSQFIHTGAAIQTAGGPWVFATALEVSSLGVNYCAGHVLAASPPCPAPTRPCS